MTGATATLEIAPLRWWHLEQVHDLESALFPVDSWSLEQFWQELAQPTRRYLVALDAGEVVGYAGAFLMPPDADVQTIAVRPDRQGAGIASRLLSELIAGVAAGGATHLMLEVRADNAAALALYGRFGFARISERRRYYADGTDAVIMRLALAGRVEW
jgi:[ribosomal protein S18]-alanine N-acetyltransferase